MIMYLQKLESAQFSKSTTTLGFMNTCDYTEVVIHMNDNTIGHASM